MSDFSSRRSNPWNIYSSSSSPSSPQSQTQTDANKQWPWRRFDSSMNAISFGFVATAILISMFLIMAIFEHLFRPNVLHDVTNGLETRQMHKPGSTEMVRQPCSSDFFVVMPGGRYPTSIAQPAPLACSREGVHWPSHECNMPHMESGIRN